MQKKSESTAATADDVAELAGVSRWTVNRAFKPNASISAKSRDRVLKAAAQLDYVPDLLASSLASDSTNLVSLLVDDFSNPYKLNMLESLTRILRQHGWETLLVNTLNEDDANQALLRASQRRVDAAVLIGSRFDDPALATALGARRVKKLIVFGRTSNNPNTISICCDDRVAMNTMTDHIIKRDYKCPLFLAGPQTQSAHLLRKDTFIKRWSDSKGSVPPVLSVKVYDPKLAYDCIASYLATHKQTDWPDIVVCENDALAIGVIDAIQFETNLQIPNDIAVTGFDDAHVASNFAYRLTTYRQPLTEMVNALVQVLKNELNSASLENFTGQLIVRDST